MIRLKKPLKRQEDQMTTNSTTKGNKYLEGSTVVAITDPLHTLTVRRYANRIYYCTDTAKPHYKDQVYYERELLQYKDDTLKS